MNGSLLRNLYGARALFLSRFNHNPNPSSPFLSLSAASIRSIPKFYSSKNTPPDEAISTPNQSKDALTEADIVSNEELKKRIAELEKGNAEAIPSVFEAVLQRYLSGKHGEADTDSELREILGMRAKSADNTEEEDEEEEEYYDWDGSVSDWEIEEEDHDFESNSKETKD